MRFNVITIFPEIFDSLKYGVISNGFKKNITSINLFNPREHVETEYGSIDDSPYGGGEGMVMMPEPLSKTIESIPNVGFRILLSPQGKIIDNNLIKSLAKKSTLTVICGRYEGIDERFIDSYVDLEVSVGDYILSGGEFGALCIIDAISRIIPGVIGNPDSIKNDSFESKLLKGPIYTRPKKFHDKNVPEVLLSGNHKEIEDWRLYQSLKRTLQRRPDLLDDVKLSKKAKKVLEDLRSKLIL